MYIKSNCSSVFLCYCQCLWASITGKILKHENCFMWPNLPVLFESWILSNSFLCLLSTGLFQTTNGRIVQVRYNSIFADFLRIFVALLRHIDVLVDLNPCADRSRRRNRRLWHLRVRLHSWQNGVGTGRAPAVLCTQPDLHAFLLELLALSCIWIFPCLPPQASCRSLARLESAQDMHTTIYDVIRHVPEMPCHSLLK